MRHAFSFALALGVLFLAGCNSREYFEPQTSYDLTLKRQAYEGEIVDVNRYGATLSSGRYIGSHGIGTIVLEEGYRFLNEDSRYLLAADGNGGLKLYQKESGKPLQTMTFDAPVVSASIHNGLIAYILGNNSYGIYNTKSRQILTQRRSGKTFAIDARAASPLFVDSIVVMPMLDGKLVIVDAQHPDRTSTIYLSSDNAFNNVIYLSRIGDTLIAATAKKVLSLGKEGEFSYEGEVAEVAIGGSTVYLFDKAGKIIKLSSTLKPLASQTFTYAQYSAAGVYGSSVYALDKQGSLIVLDTTLSHYKIYDVGEVEGPVLMIGGKLYKDGSVIDLSKLHYQ